MGFRFAQSSLGQEEDVAEVAKDGFPVKGKEVLKGIKRMHYPFPIR